MVRVGDQRAFTRASTNHAVLVTTAAPPRTSRSSAAVPEPSVEGGPPETGSASGAKTSPATVGVGLAGTGVGVEVGG